MTAFSSLAPRLTTTLIQFLWQGVVIAGLYAVARTLPRLRQNADLRYLVACAALAAMVIVPIATYSLTAPPAPHSSPLEIAGSLASSLAPTNPSWFSHLNVEATNNWHASADRWIFLVWLMGALAFACRFAAGWVVAARMSSKLVHPAPFEWQRALDHLCKHLDIARPVRLLVSARVQSPVVMGYLRPLVLLPVGALTGLDPEFLSALLAHELAHIRRHDFLVNILQCLVESVLFYHPAVWWISNQIREERELCCDDVAVASCGNPVVYVRALAEIESFRALRPRPTLAAGGSSLSRRIARLLGKSMPPLVPMPTPGSTVAALLLCAGLLMAQRGGAQPAVVANTSLPSFEVAAIKPSDPNTQLKIDFASGGRLFVSHATLRFLIKIAYDVSDDQISGGPAWLSAKRFDLQAKPDKMIPGDPEKMTRDEARLFHEPTRLRLQRLLAERFRLELRKESKPMPIFALVTGRNGIKMKRNNSAGDPVLEGNISRGALRATRADLDTLARFLSEGQTTRPVVNMTGLNGRFDFQLDWAPDSGLNSAADPNQPVADVPDSGGISIYAALQQQLGLKLEARTGSAETLVVVGATLPSAN